LLFPVLLWDLMAYYHEYCRPRGVQGCKQATLQQKLISISCCPMSRAGQHAVKSSPRRWCPPRRHVIISLSSWTHAWIRGPLPRCMTGAFSGTCQSSGRNKRYWPIIALSAAPAA